MRWMGFGLFAKGPLTCSANTAVDALPRPTDAAGRDPNPTLLGCGEPGCMYIPDFAVSHAESGQTLPTYLANSP